jgi:hypothetical protein
VTSATTDVGLTPFADCVDRRDDGVIVVWFDYELTAFDPVVVERGAVNRLAPSGTPPTLFGPGLHTRVLSVETSDGIASWTLAGRTASSDDQTPECERLAATVTTDSGGTSTTDSGGTPTTDSGGTPTTDSGGTPTTDSGGTVGQGSSTGGCDPGERSVDGTCEQVEPVQLLLVDNVLECDGHAIARFAAVNENPYRLDEESFASTLSPQRLDGEQVTVLERHDQVAGGMLAAEFLTVRYITSVTWTVEHHGLRSAVSAGVDGATLNESCPFAALNVTGLNGVLDPTSGTIPTTGPNELLPTSLIAGLLLLAGGVLVVAAGRRRPDDEDLATGR